MVYVLLLLSLLFSISFYFHDLYAYIVNQLLIIWLFFGINLSFICYSLIMLLVIKRNPGVNNVLLLLWFCWFAEWILGFYFKLLGFFSEVPEVKQLASALHILLSVSWFGILLYKISRAVVWNWSTLTKRVDWLIEFGDTVPLSCRNIISTFFFLNKMLF